MYRKPLSPFVYKNSEPLLFECGNELVTKCHEFPKDKHSGSKIPEIFKMLHFMIQFYRYKILKKIKV